MTRTTRLGAARPQQHPAGVARARPRPPRTAACSGAQALTPARSTPRTLTSTCGSRSITAASSASGLPVAATRASRCSAVSVPSPVVAWSSMITWPDCSPPRREAAGLHRLEHVAVADGGLDDGDALAVHRDPEAEVGHHGRDRGVVAAAGRPRASPGPARRGSGRRRPRRRRRRRRGSGRRRRRARRRRRRRARAPRRCSGSRCVEPKPSLMFRPSGSVADRDDLGAGAAQRLGRDLVGGAVGAVDDDPEPVEPVRQRGQQVVDVALAGRGVLPDPADGGAGRALPVLAQPGLDGVLELVGQLVPAAGEELDAVVRHRVVAGRDHRAEVGARGRR